MCRDHLLHFITLSLTDKKKSKTFHLAWQKVATDLYAACATLAWCMKMSVILMNHFVFQMRFDVFWAGLHCALWQLRNPLSRDKWEVAGSQILTNVLTSQLSHRHPMWLILSSFENRKTCCHWRFHCPVNLLRQILSFWFMTKKMTLYSKVVLFL